MFCVNQGVQQSWVKISSCCTPSQRPGIVYRQAKNRSSQIRSSQKNYKKERSTNWVRTQRVNLRKGHEVGFKTAAHKFTPKQSFLCKILKQESSRVFHSSTDGINQIIPCFYQSQTSIILLFITSWWNISLLPMFFVAYYPTIITEQLIP